MATTNCNENISVYDISFKNVSFDELYRLYAEILLSMGGINDVETSLTDYVTRIIEPVGWNAVWKIPKHYNVQGEMQYPSNCQFLVEVHDVSLKKLQALVKVVCSLNPGDCQENGDSADGQFPLSSLEVQVPLVQLYPLRDSEGLFVETARAIQTVRFFYDHLWRPWDDEDDENFVEKHLKTRLSLYYERASGCLPEVVECRIHEILTEASEIHSRLEQLQSQMTMSDSEEELEEEDVRTCMKLRMCLETFQREMEILENPLLRNIIAKKDFSEKQAQRDEATVHIVSKRLTLGMIKSLPLEENDVLELHSSLEEALACAASGDVVLLFPGHYKVGPISWLEKNLTIKGLGDGNRVTLEAGDGCGDLFLSCNSQSVSLSNLEIIPSSDMLAAVMVHGGCLTIDHCTLRGAKNGLVILDTAEAILEECQITKSQGDAVQLRAGAKCTLTSCTIQSCLGSAVKVGSQDKKNTRCTYLSLKDCSLLNNEHFALLAECPSNTIKQHDDDVTLALLQSIPFLELSVESVNMCGNRKAEFGLCFQDCSMAHETHTPLYLEDLTRFPGCRLDELKCLQLSDSE